MLSKENHVSHCTDLRRQVENLMFLKQIMFFHKDNLAFLKENHVLNRPGLVQDYRINKVLFGRFW